MAQKIKGKATSRVCLGCNVGFITNISEVKRGGGTYCSRICYQTHTSSSPTRADKVRQSNLEQYANGRVAYFSKQVGDKHPRWLKDRTIGLLKQQMRSSDDWATWRESVFTRDGFRCIDCGERQKLEPHHIIPLKETLSRAFDINNGITLCRACHRKTLGKEKELASTYFSFVPMRA